MQLEEWARRRSPIQRLDPRIKVLTTLLFIGVVMSYGRYEIAALVPWFLFPVVLLGAARLPAAVVLRRLAWGLPFVLAMALFNPLFDSATRLVVGGVPISGGWLSLLSILLRYALTAGAVVILVATTGIQAVCLALERLGVPAALAAQLLFLYRYLFLLADEAGRALRARALRCFGRRGIPVREFGHLAGNLLLRAYDRSHRVHLALCCRGFDGRIRPLTPLALTARDAAFAGGWTAVFVLFRWLNLPREMGWLLLGGQG